MSFAKYEEKKQLSLPSLIDIIFLLLVFSLVTQPRAKSRNDVQNRSVSRNDMELPVIQGIAQSRVDEILKTLMFEIVFQQPQNTQSPRMVYALRSSGNDSITYERAKQQALRDSLFAVFPENFLSLSNMDFEQTPACRFIRNEISSFKQKHFFKPAFSNFIEIRAEKNVEFRIVQYIMSQCSAYGDTIPRVTLRTLSGRDRNRGL